MTAQDDSATRSPRERVVSKPAFLVLALGELLRLGLLALLVSDRFFFESTGPIGFSAWLVVILSPHAVLASTLAGAAFRPRAHPPPLATILPAKALGVLSTLVALVSELTAGARGAIRLGGASVEVPDVLVLAVLYTWDLVVLVAVLHARLKSLVNRPAATPPPLAPPAPLPLPPLEVEVVPDDEGDKPRGGRTQGMNPGG